MGGVFKIVGKDGKVTFSDRPAGDAGDSVATWKPGAIAKPEPKEPPKSKAEQDFDTAKADIALARKHIPNLVQYLEYVEYLRSRNPIAYDAMLAKLAHDDPEIWLKLQKFPQFQPLSRTLSMANAGENRLALAANFALHNYSGGIDKWAQSTLKDLMKRDGFYTDVLGAKATTLPKAAPRVYSNSKLGQYLAQEVPRQEAAATAAAKDLAKAREGVRTGAATAFSRIGGTVLDVEIAALNPETASSVGIIVLHNRIQRLVNQGKLEAEDEVPQQLLSQGRYPELKKYLDDAERKSRAGGQ